QKAGASAVVTINDVINIKLPYLAEVNREKLEADLGEGVRVTRTAVMLPSYDADWQLRLLSVLERLGAEMQTGVGM
ncbi:hypothetical protein KDA23_06735, partial [Candidatus Saccharibacteria bacterium]|nr:hypothetical protein [Candidatus Saccharibacteria bacterium]